ncbi:ABC transporter ATP-binding protein [Streptomyces litmocidini]|uniref:ABC transporter ATP-binding protein n=1 Tax=Streptomyces litmocidini TaxID=67318 RepID=UPI00167EE81B|nr:ATP-binding cassette domain-containing protein [Streptomyces litmocidini]GGV00199.1 ABC transporter ATP-binding protein [Streptomyces litmocidini]
MSVIKTAGLTRRFGEVTALDGLTLELPRAGVIGLVGPNGSGKSTLIRMLLGLIAPTSGTAEVLDEPIGAPGRYLGRVGALVENPAFVPGLSARANLMSLARLRGLPAPRVDEVLRTVGLTGRDAEPVKRFSLGMKQRLGIAAALLPDPELLILDEPTNGLDPSGIVEIRGLLADLARAGRTVIVSSHLLAEIETVCDFLVVIRFGHLVYSGPVTDLLARTGQRIEIAAEHARDTSSLLALLAADGWQVEHASEDRLSVTAEERQGAELNRCAARGGITLTSMTPVRGSLEEIFLEMTGTSDQDLTAARAAAAERKAS